MKIFALLTLSICFVFSSNLLAEPPHVKGQIIVQIQPGSDAERVLNVYRVMNGTETGIRMERCLSKPMNIYLLSFNNLTVNEHEMLRSIKAHPVILNAQFNHFVQPRETLPDDTNFSQQWHHVNAGAGQALEDADIDSDLAWDITTGGVTALGDTIVICIIEGGNLLHPDLIENAWINHAEIPDNGLDDDENGYIDDYQGWNVQSESDEGVYMGDHGTSVMGMIGAKGNNDLGISGANWNVKMMSVAGENLGDEASVVEAYTYPLVQRQIYNETNGERGAFVVATNASWGIDFGDPNDVPIWSAFYDTLGVYGILNCGATANNNVNIDEVGDIPTAVPSDYMISVTATNSSDIRTFSGYGVETVDLGAPGSNVYTTSGSNGYTFTSGTSFASPLTAGVIGLMYAVPCQSFAELVRDNPQLGADYVRYALFEGVDPVANLQNETATGGRLNAHNSLQILLANCGEDLCLPPFSFSYDLTADTVYTFSWTTASAQGVVIRYRSVPDEEWIYITGIEGNTWTTDSLPRCGNFEFQIAANCSEDLDLLSFGNSILFETKGCCIAPTQAVIDSIEETGLTLAWETDFGIESYLVYYRLQGTEEWILAGASSSGFFELSDLDECSFYEILINPACADSTDIGLVEVVRTLGCGHCIDSPFCPSIGESTEYEFIDEVAIGSYLNSSGNNNGYFFFENTGLELEAGATYDVTLIPGFSGNAYSEFFNLWIDLDQNGLFEPGESLLASTAGSPDPLTGAITIPFDANLGTTRLRVAMKYVGGPIPDNVGACEIYDEGETEDYCITILQSTVSTSQIDRNVSVSIFPNPSQGAFQMEVQGLEISQQRITIEVFDLSGRTILAEQLTQSLINFELNEAAGVYGYRLVDHSGITLHQGKVMVAP